MRLKDELSGPEWQRIRNAQLAGGEHVAPAREPLSDNIPMEVWQQTRGRQKIGVGNVTTERGPAGGGGGGAAPPKLNVDWAFLGEREGYRRDMYVPTKDGAVIDQSGPTIGKGVDLGQMNPADLRALNLSPELEARLSPYLGKRKQGLSISSRRIRSCSLMRTWTRCTPACGIEK